MTRARRVHQGERTHSERQGLEIPEGCVGTLTVHPDGTSDAHLEPEGTELSSEPAELQTGKLCKACANKAPTGGLRAVTSPSGTPHLQATATLTLCGRDITAGWAT